MIFQNRIFLLLYCGFTPRSVIFQLNSNGVYSHLGLQI